MYRENWENKINKLQLWKRRVDLDTSRHKSCSIRRWQKCHPLRSCPTSSSTMHFDESMESVADSDLEDGKLQTLLTSSLCAQGASGRPNALVIQERGVNAQTSHSSEGREATGRPVALFSPKRNEQRNQTWSSVFGNAIVSNVSETLLEGDKDLLLNRARADLARGEIHVESLNKCIDDLQKRRQDVQNEFVESRREQTRLQEELLRKEKFLRDTQIRTKHVMERMKRAQVQQVDEMSTQKLRENHRDFSTAHITIAAIAGTDEFYEQFLRIPEY